MEKRVVSSSIFQMMRFFSQTHRSFRRSVTNSTFARDSDASEKILFFALKCQGEGLSSLGMKKDKVNKIELIKS